MKIKDVGALFLLSMLWGGSFLFIRIAAPVLGPVALMALRVLIAGSVLLLVALATHTRLELRQRWRHYLVIGIINSAIPFTLIAVAELHLTAGLAAILNATTPLFGAVIAAIWIKETLTIPKVIGLILGLLGVGVLVGWSPLPLTIELGLSILASLAAAACYGFGGVYTKVYARGAGSLALATCSQLGACAILLPGSVIMPPTYVPALPVLLAVAALALVCTALAYLLFFWLIEHVGPTRTLTVTFLVPIFGILWGAVLLHESLTFSTFLGFGIILSSTGFVTGLRLRKQHPAPSLQVSEVSEEPQTALSR